MRRVARRASRDSRAEGVARRQMQEGVGKRQFCGRRGVRKEGRGRGATYDQSLGFGDAGDEGVHSVSLKGRG